MGECYRERMIEGQMILEGREYLGLTWEQEESCQRVTDEWFPTAGVKAPDCLDNLGIVLSFLDRLATCWWGCRGGEHIVERLILQRQLV